MSRIPTSRRNAPSRPRFDARFLRSPARGVRAGARRARAAYRAAADVFPPTPLGMLVAGAAAAGLVFVARPRNDLVLLVICAAALGIAALSLVLVVLTAAGMFIALRRLPAGGDPLRLECGVAARTGFSVVSLWFLPLVKIRWAWSEPSASVEAVKRGGRLHEVVTPERRGRGAKIVRRIEIGDTFHLVRITLTSIEARAIRAFPSPGIAKALSFAHTLAEGGDLPYPADRARGEPSDFRRYAAGDPMRFILWKTFAKSRQLMVRAPEQAISPARRTIAYLVAGEGDEAAAGVARAAIQSGAFGSSWVFGADGTSEVARDLTQALEVLAASGGCPPDQGGLGVEAFLRSNAEGGAARVILFTPPSPGPWLERAAAAARAWSRIAGGKSAAARWLPGHGAGGVEAVVCTDGIARPRSATWLTRLVVMQGEAGPSVGALARASSQIELAAVLRALGAAGAELLLANRRAGQIYTGRQARALLTAAEDARERRGLEEPQPARRSY